MAQFWETGFWADGFWAEGFWEGQAVEPPVGGGSGSVQKPRLYSKTLQIALPTGSIDVTVEPIEGLTESSASYQAEINRFGEAMDRAAWQIEAAEKELEALSGVDQVEYMLRYQLLLQDVAKAYDWLAELLEQIQMLNALKQRREEEELLALFIGVVN